MRPPISWAETTLGQVVAVVRGVSYKKEQARSTAEPGFVPILRATNINGDLNTESDLVYVPSEVVSPDQVLRVGDVVMATSSGSSSVVGKSAAVRAPWAGSFGAFCGVLRAEAAIDPGYLAAFVASPEVRHRWSDQAKGTNINNLKRSHILETPLPLPPLAEQKRIVATIEEQFSRLDAAESSLLACEQRLLVLRRAAVANHLTAIDANPVRLVDLCDHDRKIAYGVLQPGPHCNDGVPLVRVGDITSLSVSSVEKRIAPDVAAQYRRTQLRGGEVLLSVVGTIGRAAVVSTELRGGNVARAVAVLPIKRTVEPKYVAIALNAARGPLDRLAHEVARKTLNLEDVREFEIKLPSLEEQRAVVDDLERLDSTLEVVSTAVTHARVRAAYLRKAVFAEAFSGRLVPQDPSDEPASELLARIAAERPAPPTPRQRKRA